MTANNMPDAEIVITTDLVRDLLREQHQDLADQPIGTIVHGWDNAVVRVGDRLAVRLPRREQASALLENEQRWLPAMAERLPLSIPSPLRVGEPSTALRYPWRWSVIPWFRGHSAIDAPPTDPSAAARTLGAFLSTMHQPAAADAPKNPHRGGPLPDRNEVTRRYLLQFRDLFPAPKLEALGRCWDRALAAAPWSGSPRWLHGDLHPGNLVVDDGKLTAVIDFGDITAGDPATDLGVAWMLFDDVSVRSSFFEAAGVGADTKPDRATRRRAQGWALSIGAAMYAHSANSPEMAIGGRRALQRVLACV